MTVEFESHAWCRWANGLHVRTHGSTCSTNVAIKNHTGTALDAMVTGELTLHSVARSITAPVSVRVEGNTLTATGRFPVKQTDYGIKPVSVGGVVSVKDVVNVSFTIVAR